MKKAVAVGFVLMMTVSSFAGFVADTVDLSGEGNYLGMPGVYFGDRIFDSEVNTFTYTHNIAFNPAAESINEATLTLELGDADFFSESGQVTIETITLGFQSNSWGFISGDHVFDVTGAITTEDGSYDVTVTRTSTGSLQNFRLLSSTLAVNYKEAPVAPTSVPEPTIVSLLGVGLLGLAGITRKKRG